MIKPCQTDHFIRTFSKKEIIFLPRGWFTQIRLGDKQPDLAALILLADLIAEDPSFLELNTMKKPFLAIRKSYRHYTTLLGISKKQVIDILERLKNYNIIQELDLSVQTPKGRPSSFFSVTFNTEILHQTLYQKSFSTQGKQEKISDSLVSSEFLYNVSFIPSSMIDLWNTILKPSQEEALTPARSKKLPRLLSRFFSNNLENWRAFCHSLQKNSWYQSHITLNHILTPKAFALIYQNSKTDSVYLSSQQAQIHISTLSTCLDQEFAHAVVQEVGAATYMTWFQEVKLRDLQSEQATLIFPNSFFQEYVQRRFSQPVLKAIQRLSPAIKTLGWKIVPYNITQDLTFSSKGSIFPSSPLLSQEVSEVDVQQVEEDQNSLISELKGSHHDLSHSEYLAQKKNRFSKFSLSDRTFLPEQEGSLELL